MPCHSGAVLAWFRAAAAAGSLHWKILRAGWTVRHTGFHVHLKFGPTGRPSSTSCCLADANLPLLSNLPPVALKVFAGCPVVLRAAQPSHLHLLHHVFGADAWVGVFTALKGACWFGTSSLRSEGHKQVHHDGVRSVAGAGAASSVSPVLVHSLAHHPPCLVSFDYGVGADIWWVNTGMSWAANTRCPLQHKRGGARGCKRTLLLLANNLWHSTAPLGREQLLPWQEDRGCNSRAVGETLWGKIRCMRYSEVILTADEVGASILPGHRDCLLELATVRGHWRGALTHCGNANLTRAAFTLFVTHSLCLRAKST